LMLLSPSENILRLATVSWAPSLFAMLFARSNDPGPATTDGISVIDDSDR
jgi:hypothetical protein